MKKIFLLVGCLAAVSACKKDPTTPTPSRLDLLTAKPWRITAETNSTTSSTGTVTTTDDYAKIPACGRDDFFKFNLDKTVVADEGPTKCDPSFPQTKSYTWEFNGDQTQLLVTPVGKTKAETDDIVELTATTMRLRTTTNSSGAVSTQNITLTAF